MSEIGLIGYGSCLPKRRVTTQEIAQQINEAPENQGDPDKQTTVEWLTQRTGVEQRARADLRRESVPIIGTIAAERALEDAGIKYHDLDFIIAATNLTDQLLVPGIGSRVQFLLNEKEKPMPVFDINAGCSSGIVALEEARNRIHYMITKGKKQNPRGLIVIADTLSNISDHHDRSAAHILGDGAAAIVIAPVEEGGLRHIFTRSEGSHGYHIAYTGYGERPQSKFMMNGKNVHQFISRRVVPTIEELLNESGYSFDDLDRVNLIPHQMNMRSLEEMKERMMDAPNNKRKVAPKRMYIEGIRNYGNTSSASPFIGIDEMYRGGKINKGEINVIMVFGGGLTSGGAVEVTHREKPAKNRGYDAAEQEARVTTLNEIYDTWKSKLPPKVKDALV